MNCTNCGNKIKGKAANCKNCGAAIPGRKPKAKKLGNCAIIFAFFMPVLGFVLGIIALCTARNDITLRNDGIKAIIMSIIVCAVLVLFIIVLLMLGTAAPFILKSMGIF